MCPHSCERQTSARARLRAAHAAGHCTGPGASRAWKLFLLTPRMLLARTEQRGSHGRAELLGRAAAFQRGDWIQLLQSARRVSRPAHDTPTLPPDEVAERKRHQACAKVRQGELSRARQVLTACDLAPGTEATWAALTDPARRPPEARTAIDPDILQHQPSQPVHLTTGAVAAALRSARRGSAPGLSAMCAEHLKFLLQDGEAIELLAEASALLAQARVPADVCKAIAMARRAALRKADGGVRGIATGDMFRRLVSKAPAREWVEKFDHATRPFQFALQARAGTDALAAHVRAALATRRGAVLVSLDGRSAHDSILGKLRKWHLNCFRSCVCSTGALPRTVGGIQAGDDGMLPSAKAVSKGTPSPPRVSPSDSTMPFRRRRKRSIPATASSPSWTTSTWSRCRPGLRPPSTPRCALSRTSAASPLT